MPDTTTRYCTRSCTYLRTMTFNTTLTRTSQTPRGEQRTEGIEEVESRKMFFGFSGQICVHGLRSCDARRHLQSSVKRVRFKASRNPETQTSNTFTIVVSDF